MIMTSEMHSSPEIAELAKAMVKVQQALTPACKDAENPFAKNRYATLNSVIEACRDALAAQSIWVAQYPVAADPGHLGLVTKLVHAESGQWQSSIMVMPLPKNDPQGYGSALTYARRYGLATLVGLVSEIDDDAEATIPNRSKSPKATERRNSSSPKPPPQNPPAPPADSLVGLPKIDGVNYQTIVTSNGRTCITASGDVRNKRPFLQEAGFRWDDNRKIWWRYAQDRAA
jgi:hypothetical protein